MHKGCHISYNADSELAKNDEGLVINDITLPPRGERENFFTVETVKMRLPDCGRQCLVRRIRIQLVPNSVRSSGGKQRGCVALGGRGRVATAGPSRSPSPTMRCGGGVGLQI